MHGHRYPDLVHGPPECSSDFWGPRRVGRVSATLEWAFVNGAMRGAAEFVGVAAPERPTGICPCCCEAIVWKAGDVNIPHVAHRPEQGSAGRS